MNITTTDISLSETQDYYLGLHQYVHLKIWSNYSILVLEVLNNRICSSFHLGSFYLFLDKGLKLCQETKKYVSDDHKI